MSNTQTVGLVFAAAALSIVLASQMQSGPSLLSDHRPTVPGMNAWQKTVVQSGTALINQR
jgi:hypothetical protein